MADDESEVRTSRSDPAGDVAVAVRAAPRTYPAPHAGQMVAAERPVRRSRHAATTSDDDDDGYDRAVDSADDGAAAASHGRHGGSGTGLTVAELIARAAASAPMATIDLGGEPAPVRSAAPAPVRPVEPAPVRPAAPAPVRPAAPAPVRPVEPAIVRPVEPDPARTRRAGRNLPAAIAVGLTLGAVIVASLLTYRPSFLVVVCLAVVLGSYELVRAIATVEARAPLTPLLVGGVAMDLVAWHRGPDGLVGALMLTALGLGVWRLADGASGYRHDVAAGNLVALYVPFLAGFAVLLARPDDGAARVILFIAAVVCSDTGGYVAGVLFGKHPMAPMVSPKKSWEGFTGSVIACALAGSLIMDLTFHHAWWKGAVFGLAIAIVATLGDLGESMIKRDLALKDMGTLLPGHGGIMDRLDSLLPCAPVAYLLLSLFLRK